MSETIDEQKRYYAERAPEYDDWWYRRGRYVLEPDALARWWADVAEADAALEAFAPHSSVLELAAGTGIWTRKLVRLAERVVALDANAETLVLNTPEAELVQADLFAWRPKELFDLVFFSFWLSHVPPERFGQFWSLVRTALAPGGRVFFIDNLASPEAAALDPEHPGSEEGSVVRHLSDGRAFRVWKVLHRPKQLVADLGELGWDATAHRAGRFFLHCRATPRGDR